MKKYDMIIYGFILFLTGCKSIDKQNKDFTTNNLIERFYWHKVEISGRNFYNATMYLPFSLDSLSEKNRTQFDLNCTSTTLYQYNSKGNIENNYLKFESIADVNTERPLIMIKGAELNVEKVTFEKRKTLSLFNYGEPIIRKKSESGSGSSPEPAGAYHVFQNKILVINFPNKIISLLDSTSSDLENCFSFVKCKIENKKIIIPISINGRIHDFMYETGASLLPMVTSLANWTEITNQKINDSLSITNFENTVTMFGSIASKEINIGMNSLPDFNVYHAKDNYFDKMFEQFKCDGVISDTFFFNKVICIDFKTKRFGIAK
jgi:hypothetical protein